MYSKHYLTSLFASLANTEVSISGARASVDEGLDKVGELLREVQRANRAQIFLGNGASAAFAEHMSLDWTKNGNLRSMSPSSCALLTALSNDISYEHAFALFVEKYAQAGDLILTISSSGNSANIINAIQKAKAIGCPVVTLSGLKPDNASRSLGDVNFYVPAMTYGIVECAHQVLLHMLLDRFMDIEEWTLQEHQNMKQKMV